MTAAVLFGSFIIMLLLNVPIAVCLGLSSVFALLSAGMPLTMVPGNYYAASNKFILLAIPFFILGGNIMAKGGISGRLINLARSMVGHIRGGMAIVCVVCACFFAAISGSGPATVAALGVLVIPAMIEAGYEDSDASALMSVSGTIGLIIPPSILFVVYGSITGVSVSDLFMGGVIPGIVMGLCLIIACLIKNRHRKLKTLPKTSWKERRAAFKDAFLGLMMPVIILGGIYGGVFTPTEAAAVSAVYGLLVGIFVYHSITLSVFKDIIKESVEQTASVMFINAAASLFAWVITMGGYGEVAATALITLSGGNLKLLLLVINIILLFAGMVMDGTSASYIFVPFISAAAISLGYDPVALGVLTVMNLAIGNATPPVGVCLYVGCNIGRVSMKQICKAAFPYIAASIIALFIITYVPQLSLLLVK
ncbi:TRAP transporter large permease [Clostridium sp. Marseille-P2415]|uniref:TRAP transporter large permease n=1 Tax=Clostridium sp. Marseille-P2415 TaxID=1805471 RepID=UPI0009887AF1|nr:TRAP transporter large permease [Clostridium sp. Marseille-P2415]